MKNKFNINNLLLIIPFIVTSCNNKREEVNILDYSNVISNDNILYDIDPKELEFKLFKINDSIYIKEGYYNNQLVGLDTLKNNSNFYFDGWIKRRSINSNNIVYYEMSRINNQTNLNQQISYNNCKIDYSNSFFYELNKKNNLLKLKIYNKYVTKGVNNFLFLVLSDKLKNDFTNINDKLKYDTIYYDTIFSNGKESDIINFKLSKNDIKKNGYFVFLCYDKNDKLISSQRLYYKNKSSNMKFECK